MEVLIRIITVTAVILSCNCIELKGTEHIVAVYEHADISGFPSNREEAAKIMRANADIYSTQIITAKSKGAELITFPEYGLTGRISAGRRESVYPYMENIPEVNTPEACMSCDSCNFTTGSETINYLSCLARNSSIYVVVNLLERVVCEDLNQCPHGDGLLIYNTNIIFDPQGCIVAKYHKYHMWGLEREVLDKPNSPEYVYIDTPLGRLGTFICFDGSFEEPGLSLVNKCNVDTILFPTYWTMMDASTRFYQNIIEYSSGWAKRQNVNFLVSNIRNHEDRCYGSAIATPTGIAAAYYEPENTEGRLLLAKIQSKYPNTEPIKHMVDTSRLLHKQYDYVTVTAADGREYHVKPLQGANGSLEVCHNNLCCNLEYKLKSGSDLMVLAAYSWFLPKPISTDNPPSPTSIEVCLLLTCKSNTLDSCFDFPISQSNSIFDKLVLSGRFTSIYAYPMVVGSEYNVTGFDWNYRYAGQYNEIEMTDVNVPVLRAALQTLYDGTNSHSSHACGGGETNH